MNNFEFCISTKAIFGKGQIEKLPEVVEAYGKKVLLAYGGGSIKKIGVYDTIKTLLSKCEVVELSGIEANPKISSVREGVRLCRENEIDVILAVGGGSVIDCAKVISAAFYYEGDVYDMLASHAPVGNTIPIIAVPTVAATGSEMNFGAVVVNPETNEKMSVFSTNLMPKAAILDPTYTFTVSKRQTAAGCADILLHLMEQYFLPETSDLADALVEGVMKTVIHYARIAMDEPENYEARAQILWASEIADNATLSNGNKMAVFPVHNMEHQLSGRFDSIHGEGLAILTPAWMKYVLSEKTVPRFAKFATNVFGIVEADEMNTAQKGIEAIKNFFTSLDIPQSLAEIGADEEQLVEMGVQSEQEGSGFAWIPLSAQDCTAIYRMCYSFQSN